MKKTLYILAILAVSIFTACNDDDDNNKEYTLTVASAERIMFISDHHQPYFVKKEGENKWTTHSYIKGFNLTEGYEYVIRVRCDYDKSKENMDGGSPYSYHLLEEISKTEKDSEDYPIQNGWLNISPIGTGDAKQPYSMLDHKTGKWVKIDPIDDFDYEEGYHYILNAEFVYHGSKAEKKYTLQYISVQSKTKVESTES